MTALPHSATFDLTCPDCGGTVPIGIDFTSVVDRSNRVAEISVSVSHSATARFVAHVNLNPEAHPTFATPIES